MYCSMWASPKFLFCYFVLLYSTKHIYTYIYPFQLHLFDCYKIIANLCSLNIILLLSYIEMTLLLFFFFFYFCRDAGKICLL